MRIEDLIYDVGMNNGDDTAYYLSLGFRTVAIEANPELVEQAKARFAREIASGRLIILNIGIADREGGASVLDLRDELALEFIRPSLRIVVQPAQSPNPSAMYAI